MVWGKFNKREPKKTKGITKEQEKEIMDLIHSLRDRWVKDLNAVKTPADFFIFIQKVVMSHELALKYSPDSAIKRSIEELKSDLEQDLLKRHPELRKEEESEYTYEVKGGDEE